MSTILANTELDVATLDRRAVNQTLQDAERGDFTVTNPGGAHALACGLMHPIGVTIKGHTGYYCAGMNKEASITIEGEDIGSALDFAHASGKPTSDGEAGAVRRETDRLDALGEADEFGEGCGVAGGVDFLEDDLVESGDGEEGAVG